MTLGIVLRLGPRRGVFIMSEMPLYPPDTVAEIPAPLSAQNPNTPLPLPEPKSPLPFPEP